MSKKRYIPGSNPDWNLELPDGYSNSLVTKDGKVWDNGYNFDEIDDEEEMPEFDPKKAEEERKKFEEEQGRA